MRNTGFQEARKLSGKRVGLVRPVEEMELAGQLVTKEVTGESEDPPERFWRSLDGSHI